MSDETQSRADVLSAAYDKIDAATTTTTPVPTPGETTQTPAPATATQTPAPEPGATSPASPERPRDERGRFAPKDGDTSAPKAEAPKPAATATPAPAPGATTTTEPPPPPKFKPPQSWKPLAREKWSALPPEAQEEIDRREREIAKALQESSEPRKNWERFNEAIRPYEAMLRTTGKDPIAATENLLQSVYVLQTGTPQQKAWIAAQVIQGYGVDIQTLAAMLDGQGPAPQRPQQPTPDPRAIVREEVQAMLQQANLQRAQSELEGFGAKHEFLDDVRDTMADLLEAASKRGIALSLDDAYNRAVALDPDLSKVMEQRKAAEAAKAQQASTLAAKAAASSVRSNPTAAPTAQPTDRREVLLKKYDEIASR